jgi:hypothetical protein
MHSTRLTTMDALAGTQEHTPARMVAGALAHLATHMSSGCPRAGYLAAMLLEKIASDTEADDHLRRHARELVDILDADHITPLRSPPISSFVSVEAS